MPNEKVDRFQREPQMHFRVVIERRTAIAAIAMAQRPLQNIAEAHVIQVELVRDLIIEPNVVVENRFMPDGAIGKRDRPARLAPDEKSAPFRNR